MNRKGFTLIELVMVIVLIGIIAVFIAPRLGNITTTNAGPFMDKLRADIRYAQNQAMTKNRRIRVNLTNTSYSVSQDNSPANNCGSFAPVADPAEGGNLSIALDTGSYAGITITPSITCLEYDALGRPYDCTIAPAPAACSTTLSGMNIAVVANAATTVGAVTVSAQTGAVN